MSYVVRFMSVFLAIIVLSSTASAQSKKDLAAQDVIILDRLARLEARMLTGDPAAERLMQSMDALEGNMRTLTGEVERLRFERDALRTEVAALVSSMSGLQALAARTQTHLDAVDLVAQEQTSRQATNVPTPDNFGAYSVGTAEPYFPDDSANTNSGLAGQPSQVPSAPEFKEQTIGVQQYGVSKLPQTGQQKLAEGDFAGAQTAFKQYLAVNPDAPDAGEVNYWLGESYFVRGGYADAADAYITSMRKDPTGAKAPNALVGLAATMRELGNKTEACAALDSLPSQFPNASSSVREKARIQSARTGC